MLSSGVDCKQEVPITYRHFSLSVVRTYKIIEQCSYFCFFLKVEKKVKSDTLNYHTAF